MFTNRISFSTCWRLASSLDAIASSSSAVKYAPSTAAPQCPVCFSTASNSALPSAPEIKQKLSSFMAAYEEFIGIAHVKKAQDAVIHEERERYKLWGQLQRTLNVEETQEAETVFLRAQSKRREAQLNLNELQARLRDLHTEIAKTSRGEDRYLTLITEEHRALRDEQRAVGECRILERDEHELFAAFSNAVRSAHERERSQAEKTKYWSILGSAVGAVIGIVGASLTNWLRMRELRSLVSESSAKSRSDDARGGAGEIELRHDLSRLSDTVDRHHNQLAASLNHLQDLFSVDADSTNTKNAQPEDLSAGQSVLQQLRQQLNELKQLQYQLQISSCSFSPQQLVGAEADGDSFRSQLSAHEQRVEQRLMEYSVKLALAGVVCGAAVAATLATVFGR